MTPERYKRLTDWLEGHPALREGIILLNRWLSLVPFVCYPVLLVLLNLRWFRMLTIGRGSGALDFMQAHCPGHSRSGSWRSGWEPSWRRGSTFPALMSSRASCRWYLRRPTAIPALPATHSVPPSSGWCGSTSTCRRRRDAGHRRPHLSAAGAFWGALRPGCAGRRSLRAYVRLCGDVAAVRSLLQKAQKSFRFLLTEPRGYGIILLAACFGSQLRTISEPNGITTCARSSGG